MMGRFLALAGCLALVLGGCSLLSDFGGYSFTDDAPDSGEGTDRGDGGGEPGGPDAGSVDAGGVDAGGSGGSGGGGGGTGGTGGVGADCMGDAECGPGLACVDGVCTTRQPGGTWVTAGGGTVASERYRARVSVGAPVPMGAAKSEHYGIVVGPVAGRP